MVDHIPSLCEPTHHSPFLSIIFKFSKTSSNQRVFFNSYPTFSLLEICIYWKETLDLIQTLPYTQYSYLLDKPNPTSRQQRNFLVSSTAQYSPSLHPSLRNLLKLSFHQWFVETLYSANSSGLFYIKTIIEVHYHGVDKFHTISGPLINFAQYAWYLFANHICQLPPLSHTPWNLRHTSQKLFFLSSHNHRLISFCSHLNILTSKYEYPISISQIIIWHSLP